MNLLTTLFAATIGISPINDDILREDIQSLYFTDIMCSAIICNRLTLSGGITTDSKYSHKAYFKPIQGKYYAGLSVKLHDFIHIGVDHDCRHTVSSYDSTYDRYDISKTFEYISVGADKGIVYAKSRIGALIESQRYSYPRAEILDGKMECFTYTLDDRKTNFCYNFIWGIRYKGFHFRSDNLVSIPSYSSIKASLEYEMKHSSIGCMYEWTSEKRVQHNSISTNKLQCYVKVFN